LSSLMNAPVPEGCRFCGGTLPEGRNVIYCPHCGNNLSVSRCPACGSELEKGWKFCATCGRGVG
jgi:predicted amidophosphoribosyltransferase